MNVIDTSKFVVSEQANYSIIDYDGVNIIEIENFIENFDEFKDFILSIPVEKNVSAGKEVNREHGFAPGYHATLSYEFANIKNKIFKIIKEVYGDIAVDTIKFQTNIFDTGIKCPDSTIQPHVDPCKYALNLWLNEEEDCNGGTGFYIHSKTKLNYFFDSVDPRDYAMMWQSLKKPFEEKDKISDFDYNEVNDCWELGMVSKMKTNRVVIYPASCFHAVYTKPEWFSQKKRTSMAGFVI